MHGRIKGKNSAIVFIYIGPSGVNSATSRTVELEKRYGNCYFCFFAAIDKVANTQWNI